jgi:hypothetical protein
MQVEIVIDKEYAGPGIVELSSSIPNITDKTIEIRWTNSKDEIHAMHGFRFPGRQWKLHVPDAPTFDRALSTFGGRLKLPAHVLDQAKIALIDPQNYNWRKFSEELHDTSPRYAVLQLAANAIRKGMKPSLAEIVRNIFIDGISPIDTDVLLRLKSGRIRG